MGEALLTGLLLAGMSPTALSIIEPSEEKARQLKHAFNLRVFATLDELEKEYAPACIVFAVKPQSLDTALPAYAARFAKTRTAYISVAAGKTLAYYENILGKDVPVIRMMPNTPALVLQGMSVAIANNAVTPAMREDATALFKSVGDVAWVNDEALMHAVTATSASGPAYVFYFLECMIGAAVKQGLDEDTAKKLALQTLRGSIELAARGEKPLAELRENVTSKGGTTEAALAVFAGEEGLKTLMERAIAAAVKRSKELAD